MKKFAVYGLFHGSKYLGEFEAETKEEAIEMALASNENHVSLCHHCSGQVELNDFSASEADADELE